MDVTTMLHWIRHIRKPAGEELNGLYYRFKSVTMTANEFKNQILRGYTIRFVIDQNKMLICEKGNTL